MWTRSTCTSDQSIQRAIRISNSGWIRALVIAQYRMIVLTGSESPAVGEKVEESVRRSVGEELVSSICALVPFDELKLAVPGCRQPQTRTSSMHLGSIPGKICKQSAVCCWFQWDALCIETLQLSSSAPSW